MLAFFLACSPPPGEPAPADGTTPEDTGEPAPTGDSVGDAVPLADGAGAESIDPAGDVDYWSVEVAAGAILDVTTSTVADPEADCDGSYDNNPLDTVVIVYDVDGNELLAADEWYRGVCGRDARGAFRAEVAGTYTLAVLDWNSWEGGGAMFGNPPAGGPEYTYTLRVDELAPVDGGGALPGSPPVTILDGSDADVWDVAVATRAWLTVQHPTNTNAGTDDLVIEVADASGVPLARWSEDAFYGTRWGVGVTVPVAPGDYAVRVWDTDGADAIGDWYWLWTEGDEESATNPDAEGTAALTTRAGDGEYEGDYVQARFDGRLAAGETDTFVVSVTEGQYVYLSVYSGAVGSLADVEVRMLDVDGATELASEAGAFVSIERERPSADGELAIAVTAGEDGYYLGYLEVWDSRRPW